MKRAALALLAIAVYGCAAAEGASLQSPITIETLAQSTSSWDRALYEAYPSGQSQIPDHRPQVHDCSAYGYDMAFPSHAQCWLMGPKHFVAGQVVTETVRSIHRDVTGSEPVVLIVFYPGAPGLSVSMPQEPGSREHEVGH